MRTNQAQGEGLTDRRSGVRHQHGTLAYDLQQSVVNRVPAVIKPLSQFLFTYATKMQTHVHSNKTRRTTGEGAHRSEQRHNHQWSPAVLQSPVPGDAYGEGAAAAHCLPERVPAAAPLREDERAAPAGKTEAMARPPRPP